MGIEEVDGRDFAQPLVQPLQIGLADLFAQRSASLAGQLIIIGVAGCIEQSAHIGIGHAPEQLRLENQRLAAAVGDFSLQRIKPRDGIVTERQCMDGVLEGRGAHTL
ncbi:hypothetical protein L0C21_14430 [Sphingosinicellaceae bacterium A1X5R2]|nr:hypothetical protein [Pedomonas mirosovicensis]